MKRKIGWLIPSCLVVIALIVVSRAPAVTKEAEAAPPKEVVRSVTLVVAASDSSAKSKAQADYVCDEVADDEIQAALDEVAAVHGTVQLMETPTYFTLGAKIRIPDHCILKGLGPASTKIRGTPDGFDNNALIELGPDAELQEMTVLLLANKDNQCALFGDEQSGYGDLWADGWMEVKNVVIKAEYAPGGGGAGGGFYCKGLHISTADGIISCWRLSHVMFTSITDYFRSIEDVGPSGRGLTAELYQCEFWQQSNSWSVWKGGSGGIWCRSTSLTDHIHMAHGNIWFDHSFLGCECLVWDDTDLPGGNILEYSDTLSLPPGGTLPPGDHGANGKLVYIDAAGDAQLASNDDPAKRPAIGIVIESRPTASIPYVTVKRHGFYAAYNMVATYTKGQKYYLGTGGDLTATKPTGENTLVQPVGVGVTTKIMQFDALKPGLVNRVKEVYIPNTRESTSGIFYETYIYNKLFDGVPGTCQGSWTVPDDFISIKSIKIMWECKLGTGNLYWRMTINWTQGAEAPSNAHQDETAFGASTISKAHKIRFDEHSDFSSLDFSGLQTGDYFTFSLYRDGADALDTLNNPSQHHGFILEYVAAPQVE